MSKSEYAGRAVGEALNGIITAASADPEKAKKSVHRFFQNLNDQTEKKHLKKAMERAVSKEGDKQQRRVDREYIESVRGRYEEKRRRGKG